MVFKFIAIDHSRVRGICFDVDGTLNDTDDQFVQKLANILTPMRFIISGWNILKIERRLIMFIERPGNWAYSLADRFGLDHKIVAIGDRLYEMGIGESASLFN